MNPWIWRVIIILFAIPISILVVSGTTSFVVQIIDVIGDSIHALFDPIFQSGEARLEGLIKLCLYLISITILAKILFRN
jgi:hypothetical protein